MKTSDAQSLGPSEICNISASSAQIQRWNCNLKSISVQFCMAHSPVIPPPLCFPSFSLTFPFSCSKQPAVALHRLLVVVHFNHLLCPPSHSIFGFFICPKFSFILFLPMFCSSSASSSSASEQQADCGGLKLKFIGVFHWSQNRAV